MGALSQFSGPEITGLATLIAAVIGFVGAGTVALVNAWSARSLEKAKARREYRLKTLSPLFDYTEEVIKGLEQVAWAIRGTDDQMQAALEKANVPLMNITGMGLIAGNKKLTDAWLRFKRADETCHRIAGEADSARSHREPLGPVQETFLEKLTEVRDAALEFRRAVEKFVF